MAAMRNLPSFTWLLLSVLATAACANEAVTDPPGVGADGGSSPSPDAPSPSPDAPPPAPDAPPPAPDAPPPSDAPPAEESPVLVGAGDIASCSSNGDEQTAALLDQIDGTIFAAGDLAYQSGTDSEFKNCFDPTWGRHKARIKPAPGNHEYNTTGAAGYYRYFGAAAGDPSKGYYSYDLGKWHIVVLNSNCSKIGGCGKGSPQEQWLRQDLAANPRTCTLAYWHHPRFSSGDHGSYSMMRDLWLALEEHGADVILAGHDHSYERFAPQDADGNADPNGIRSFVVGTGGKSHYGFKTVLPNSEVRIQDTWGVLKLTLHPTSYDWEFIPVGGGPPLDSGSDTCR